MWSNLPNQMVHCVLMYCSAPSWTVFYLSSSSCRRLKVFSSWTSWKFETISAEWEHEKNILLITCSHLLHCILLNEWQIEFEALTSRSDEQQFSLTIKNKKFHGLKLSLAINNLKHCITISTRWLSLRLRYTGDWSCFKCKCLRNYKEEDK